MSVAAPSLSPFTPVIPAGGSGTRLWPLSRMHHPKFLSDLTGAGTTLLEQTLERVEPHASSQPIIVTGEKHDAAVRDVVGTRARVLTEPSARNSMPAIAWAAAVAHAENPEAVIGSFAADHLIGDTASFGDVVRQARAVAELGYLVTIGIEPTHPATGFGYIEVTDPPSSSARELHNLGGHTVTRFIEKPDEERAKAFLETGQFLWNAGMFVAKARVVLEALDNLLPSVSAGARALAQMRADGSNVSVPRKVWESMTSIAIDHALAEPLATQGAVAMVRATFDWDDIGDFRSLAAQLRALHANGETERIAVKHDFDSDVCVLGSASVLPRHAHATVYSESQRPIAIVGVRGISIVESDEALLILGNEHAQELSSFVASLSERGSGNLA